MPTRIHTVVRACCLVCLVVAAAPSPPARAAETHSALAPLAWMTGSWTSTQGETTVEEHWTSPDGGLMLGMNRTRSRGRAVMFEFLRIVARGDSIFYIAMPRGRGETAFPLVERSAARVVFENPGHDFPRRVIYWREKPGELHARVEGTMNGRPAGEEWVWRRSKLAP